MKVKKLAQTDERIRLLVTLEPREVEESTQNAYMALAMHHDLKPEVGKTSRDVVAEHVDPEVVSSFVSKMAVDTNWQRALDNEGLSIIGIPECSYEDPYKEGEDFSFEIDGVRVPVFELSNYDPVELFNEGVEVTEEDIDRYLERETSRFMVSAVDDEPESDTVEPTSLVRLSMTTKKNGQDWAPLTFAERDYELGADDMPEGFDDHLVGLRIGEMASFEFEGPDLESLRKGIAPPARFETVVTVLKKLKRVRPTIDDAWVEAHVKNAKTVQQMRERVREEVLRSKTEEDEQFLRYLASVQVADRLQGAIPDEAFEAAFRLAATQFQTAMRQQGLTAEQYYRQHGITAQEFTSDLMRQTREQLRQQFALDAFARHLGMTVDEADMTAYYDLVDPGNAEKVKKQVIESGQLTSTKELALRMKVNDWLVAHAVEPKEED